MFTIHSSPLQGFTDFRFRNAFQRFFGGIDLYIAPYIRLNWNLGCPYPMIAKRGMGSGLLSMPEKIAEFLNRVLA